MAFASIWHSWIVLVQPPGYTGDTFQGIAQASAQCSCYVGYCDMKTDGGGWLLVSTQTEHNRPAINSVAVSTVGFGPFGPAPAEVTFFAPALN